MTTPTKAWLEGHQFDLEDLAEQLNTGNVRVVRDEGENAHYLTSPEIDNPPEPGRFDKPAERLIVRINGLGRAKSADYRPVKLSGKYTDPNGQHVFVAAATAEGRARARAAAVVTGPGGQPTPNPPSPWPDRFALAGTNSDVAEALEFMGATEPLGWIDLRKVYEIVRDAVKPKTIVKLGWTTKARLSAFTGSADRPDVSGREARHARLPGRPPRHTMTLAEGRSYVSDLVTKWLAWLAGN